MSGSQLVAGASPLAAAQGGWDDEAMSHRVPPIHLLISVAVGARPSRGWIRLGLVVCGLMLFLVGCAESPHLHFVLPQDFVGVFKVVESTNGAAPVKQGAAVAYTVPSARRLAVTDVGPFSAFRGITAEYPSGVRLVGDVDLHQSPLDDQRRIYFLGADTEGWYFLIGTTAEARQFADDPTPFADAVP